MLQTVDADAKIMSVAADSEEETIPVCGSSCFCAAAAADLAADAVTAVVTAGAMTVVCGLSCFSSAVADAAANSVAVCRFTYKYNADSVLF